MKRIILLISFFLLLVPAQSFALSAEVTSPFGWRTHPIFGTQLYHSGVDLGVDTGTPITAILPGTVEFAGWCGGYGYAVIIDHGNGVETLYGHCSELYVQTGQQVSAGQLISAAGSTGNSTGPHLHFELRLNGSPSDPMPLIAQAGWDVRGGPIANPYLNSDYDEMPWNFGDFYDIAKMVREILEDFSKHCTTALGFIQNDVLGYLNTLMVIDFASTLLIILILDKMNLLETVLLRFMQYGFFIYLITNWAYFVNKFILESLTDLAAKAGGGGSYIAQNMSDPSLIIQKGVVIMQPVFAYLSNYSGGMHMMANIHNVFLAMIIGLLIFAAFIYIGLHMFVAYLEFYYVAALAIVPMPFAVLDKTKFMAEQSMAAVINAGIKLMVMTFIVAIVVYNVKDFATTEYSHIVYFHILFGCGAIAFLVGRASNRIANLLYATPKL